MFASTSTDSGKALLRQSPTPTVTNLPRQNTLLIVAVIYFVVITALTQLANYVDRKVNA